MKYAAAGDSPDGPYQGMIVLIPGGPGGSGVDLVQSDGSTVQAVVGSNWDIVSFDPRGISRSEPALDCAINATSVSGNNTRRDAVPRVTDHFYNDFLDYGRELGDLCAQRSGTDSDAGPHMSTAVVARDLVSIVDAYARTAEGCRAAKNSSLLHFYGISYGTMIGQTFASMFPERVGNAALDGIVSPESYLTGWINNSINHLDGVLALFFIYCSEAGPSLCPYATEGSAHDTFARFKASFTQLNARRAEAEHWSNATDIEEALLTLKTTAFNAAYTPLALFSNLSQVLVGLDAALDSGTLKQWTQQLIAATGDPVLVGEVDWQYALGVACSDQNNIDYGRTLKDIQPEIQGLEAQSIIGEMWTRNLLGCAGWKIKSNDIFTGPFGGDTATPMLFVSNTYDPVTPIDKYVQCRVYDRLYADHAQFALGSSKVQGCADPHDRRHGSRLSLHLFEYQC